MQTRLPLAIGLLIILSFAFSSFDRSFEQHQAQELLPDTTYLVKIKDQIQRLHDASKYDSSLLIIDELMEQFNESSLQGTDSEEYWGHFVHFLGMKAESLRSLDHLEEAQQVIEKAIDLGKQHLSATNINQGRVYGIAGIIRFSNRKYKEAIPLIKKSLEIRKTAEGPMHEDLYYVYNNLGACYFYLGDYGQTIDYFNKGLQVAQHNKGEKSVDVAGIYSNLGAVSGMRRRLWEAIDYLENAVAIYQEVLDDDQNDKLAGAYANMGRSYRDLGEFDKSLAYFEKARLIYKSILGENRERESRTLVAMGQVYQSIGKEQEAIQIMEEALDIQQAFYDTETDQIANTLYYLAELQLETENLAKAKQYANQTMQIRETIFGTNHFSVAESQNQLAQIAFEEQDYDLAKARLKKALQINQAVFGSQHPTVASNYLWLSKIAHQQKNHQLAQQHLQNAQKAALGDNQLKPDQISLEEIGDFSLLADIVFFEADLAKATYETQPTQARFEQATNAYAYALSYVKTLVRKYDFASSKKFLIEKAIPAYESNINLHLMAYAKNQEPAIRDAIYRLTEETSSVLLMDALQENNAKQFAGIPEDLIEKERKIKSDMGFLEQSIYDEVQKGEKASKDRLDTWRDNIFELQKEYDEFLAQIGREYPNYYGLKYAQSSTDITDVQAYLKGTDRVVLDYYLGDSTLLIFAIRADKVIMNHQDISGQLLEDIFALRQMLSYGPGINDNAKEQDYQLFTQKASRLYQQLIASVDEMLNTKNLIILPHGALGYLPFHILLKEEPDDSQQQELNYRNLAYLFRDYTISYEYAASLLKENKPQNATNAYVGFAPVYSGKKEISSRTSDSLKLHRIFNAQMRDGLSPLQFNQPEVSKISQLFGASAFLGADASEQAFKENAESARILHLAMHTLLNDEEPLYSQLVFRESGEDGEDGRLNAYELYNMQLNAELAVLSACNTGVGKIQKGEGIMSLSRAFKYAGCPNIVMSLWPANDASTQEIMVNFFERLKSGENKDEALRNARLDYLEQASATHPFYWATFVFIGDPKPLTEGNGLPYWWLGIGVLLLAVAFFVWRNRIQTAA